MYTLDEKDHKIIFVLKENSRMSIRNIAKKIKLRPSTVHSRISKLIEMKVIDKFTIKLNNKAMGQDFIVFMMLQTSKEISSNIFKNEVIKEVFGITGEYDLIMKLKFKDVNEFNNFVIDFRKKHNLRKTLTMVATINIKEEI